MQFHSYLTINSRIGKMLTLFRWAININNYSVTVFAVYKVPGMIKFVTLGKIFKLGKLKRSE